MNAKRIALLAATLTASLALLLAWIAGRGTEGSYIYPIDDAYIHLALAKNLATFGSYGLYPEVFTGASSSIVWPLLLGALYKFWPSTHVAWVLSTGAAVAIPFAVRRTFARLGEANTPLLPYALTQALVLVATPLAPLGLSGMEHMAHALVTLLLATEVARFDDTARKSNVWMLLALSMAGSLLRYESLALSAACTFLLLRQKHVSAAGAVFVGASTPPLLFALYAKAHGWQSLPNSVILKGRRWDAETPQVIVNNLREAPHLVVLFAVLTALLLATHKTAASAAQRFALLALTVLVAHALCGGVGWFYRYEAYVIPVTVVAIGLLAAEPGAPRLARALTLPLLLLLPRGASAHRALPQASRNIFDEQVQTARFVKENFDHEPVLLNDIGAVAYFTHAPFVDLMGLANQETARARGMRIDRPLAPNTLEKLSERADVAIVYEQWFQAEMPNSWRKVGEFRTEKNRVCAFPAVSIFATKPEAVPRVSAAFQQKK